ncbi:hypothetical protein PybrP1_000766 [[Pythium] brassicae (nom. inval.)]|nr:hypothetical protein PybrP1_000766 [[Pythium] brassicae (nom. inval.)]
MTSLEQMLQRVPQAAATAATAFQAPPQEQQQQRAHTQPLPARRRSASSTLVSGSIPVPSTLRRVDFLGRGRRSSSSSSDEQDDGADSGAGAPQSASYFRPRTFEDYTRYFEQQCMEGFLEKQSSENPRLWKGRWFVMKDDKLFYYKREADARDKLPTDPTVCGVIQLADIDSVTTAKDFGVATFQIRTQSRRFVLRAESKDRMHDWLFNFQKSIASIISVLTRTQAQEHHRSNRLSNSLSRRSISRANRSVSFDFQEGGDSYGSSVMDDFYRGRASGVGGFMDSTAFSDASSSQSSSSRRASPRRATSPLSFSSFGPRSPLATMFVFDPLDDVPERLSAHAGGVFEEAKDGDDDDDNDDNDDSLHFARRASDHHTPPALLQTMSPPVATGKYIPPFLRKRMNDSSNNNNTSGGSGGGAASRTLQDFDFGGSSPPAAFDPLPAPTPGRWVPPSQREGYASGGASSSSRLSFDAHPAALSTRESFSDNFFFQDSDSYSIGDDVHGVTSLIGVRKAMEDVCCCIPDLNAHLRDAECMQKQAIYMLFDGHSGAAKFSEQRLIPYLRAHEMFMSDVRVAFEECFQTIDDEFLATAAAENLSDGTTAAVVLIRGNRLLTANIGDSRAVASIGGEALDIIEEQTPGRPDERSRIESRGGWVREEKELHMSKLHSMDLSDPEIKQRAERVVQWVNIFRVNGELAVSRAIGDIDYKGDALSKYEYWAYPEGHDRVFHDDLVIAVPEFQEIEITPEFEFLVLACDGLWDTITSKEAQASHSLANLAIRSGSSDNVSVVVVLLNPLLRRA